MTAFIRKQLRQLILWALRCECPAYDPAALDAVVRDLKNPQ